MLKFLRSNFIKRKGFKDSKFELVKLQRYALLETSFHRCQPSRGPKMGETTEALDSR